jgi:tetratricopeptide (TPR) repeat protein
LPSSETEGLGVLDVIGNYFSNIPPIYGGYVNRIHLEEELYKVIMDFDRYPIVTLKGIGGIGKTSLALSVLHIISKTERFDVVLWFSSRDIDLTTHGAKHVKNKILNEEDVASEFVELLDIRGLKKNEKIDLLAKEMTKSTYGPMLFVFDNFETVKNPVELFAWIDTYIRHPNKILITSRTSKSFKADYPIEVSGMNTEECEVLIDKTATEFGISHLLFPKDIEKIIQESNGHPYVIRIFLGEIAKNKRVDDIKRIVAGKDDILTALFRRTYSWLSPAAKRVFLTLCSWRSVIPQIALEAVLLREENERINVDDAIEELRKSSFIEVINSEKDSEYFISVPLAASIFGKNELEVSSEKFAILADRDLLQDFGAAQQSDIVHGITPRISRKFHNIANRISQGKESLENHLPTLEYLASKYPPAWIYLANIHEENNDVHKTQESYREFLKSDSSDFDKQLIWQKLADSYRSQNEWFGEVNALVEMCSLSRCSLFSMSEVANVINNYYQSTLINIDTDAKQKLILKMIDLMEAKSLNEANPTDYSRLAWLYIWLNNTVKAIEVTRKGLSIDPTNEYCKKLAIRLGFSK